MKSFKIIAAAILALGLFGCESVVGEKSTTEQIQDAYESAINGDQSFMVSVDLKQAKKEIREEGFDVWNTGIAKKSSLAAKKDSCSMTINKIGTNWARLDEQCKMMGGVSTWTYFMKKDNGVWKAPIVD